MDEHNPAHDPAAAAADAPEPRQPAQPTRRPRRRRWPWVILAIVAVLVLLVALLPTLLSTNVGKSLVVRRVNDYLNGTLAINDWSIGWTSGITLEGIKVDDQQGRRVAEVALVRVPMPLLSALRGDFNLGDTLIDKPNLVNLEVYPDGSTNLEKLVKDTGKQAEEQPGDGKLPDLRGKITINQARATVTTVPPPGEQPAPPVHLDSGDLVVTIPDINAPIANDGKFVYRVGQSPQGMIALAGTVDAVENNAVALDQLQADQQVKITDADLAAIEPFLQSKEAKTIIGGIASGALELKARGLQSAGLAGDLAVENFAYGGDALNGDIYRSTTVAIPVNIATSAAGDDTLIAIQTLKAETDHVLVDLSGQATQGALQNLAQQKAPGAAGQFALVVNTKDLPGLANALRHTLGLQKDVQVTSGDLDTRIDVTLSPQRADVKQTLDAVAAGTNAGQPVKLEPVHLETAVALPDLRDLAVKFTSAFAQIQGGGETLASLNINGNVDLGRLHDQLAQFVAMGDIEFTGRGDFQVTSSGDFTQPGGTSQVQTAVNLSNVVVRGLEGQQEINQPRLVLQSNATLVRGPEGGETIERISDASVNVQTGEAAAPVLDLLLNATNVALAKPSIERFELARLNADLPRLQRQFAAFFPPDLNLTGTLTARAAGSYEDDTARFDTLAVDTSDKFLTVAKVAQEPLIVQMKEAGIGGSGQLAIASDLKALDRVLKAFGEQLQSGALRANITLASQPQAPTTIALDGGIENLTITTNAEPIQNEKVALAARASAPADFSALNVQSATLDSAFANAAISDVQLQLDAAGVFDMLQRATAKITVPDLGRTYAVANAFAPPATQPADPATTQPLQIDGGAVVTLDVRRAGDITRVSVPQLEATNLALARGDRRYAFAQPVAMKLSADLATQAVTTPAGTQPTQQITQVQVRELGGELGGLATIRMPEPIVLTNLAGDQPNANGRIAINGSLEPLTQLLAVIQGAEPMPYRGEYAIAQNLRTDAGRIGLVGDATVNQFRVLAADGRPAFTEEKIVLANNLLADTNTNTATINTLSLTMPTSNALGLNVTGTVRDWEQQRQLQNVVVEIPYDLAKVWQIVRPMLDAQTQDSLKDLQVAGQYKSVFTLNGSYPADTPFHEAIAHVSGGGSVAVASLQTNGADIRDLELPITLDKGVLYTLYADRPRDQRAARPAYFNDGTLDLNSILVDLTKETPTLSIGKNQQLVRNAKINAILSQALGRYFNAIFANAEEADGLLDITIDHAENVPLGEAIQSDQSGRARVLLSLRNMRIVNPVIGQMIKSVLRQVDEVREIAQLIPSLREKLGTELDESKTLQGEIRNGEIVLANGRITQNITMQLTDVQRREDVIATAEPPQPIVMPLSISGDVTLANLLQNLDVNLPGRLIGRAVNSRDLTEFFVREFPNGIPVHLGGTPEDFSIKPLVSVAGAVRSWAIGELTRKLGGEKAAPVVDILEGVLGGGNKPDGAGRTTTQPAPGQQQKDPLGGLLDQLTRPKKDDQRKRSR